MKQLYKPLNGGHQTAAINITHRFKELVFTSTSSLHLVTDYASLLNITPDHLNKSVKAVTGKSPARWIDEAIVLEAKVTSLSVKWRKKQVLRTNRISPGFLRNMKALHPPIFAERKIELS